MPDTIELIPRKVARVSLQMEVLREIRQYLAPYLASDTQLSGDTVICDGTRVDSLTVMDLIIQLEDRFDITISPQLATEIRTVDDLADAILGLCDER
ncbi:MAG: acyl carrier protein [Enhydrobacter sp.]|nr:MAG: acyl carrier protein [Enhydrobacter sp.]